MAGASRVASASRLIGTGVNVVTGWPAAIGFIALSDLADRTEFKRNEKLRKKLVGQSLEYQNWFLQDLVETPIDYMDVLKAQYGDDDPLGTSAPGFYLSEDAAILEVLQDERKKRLDKYYNKLTDLKKQRKVVWIVFDELDPEIAFSNEIGREGSKGIILHSIST